MIASHLPGRTDNEIKNYWNSHLSRKVYTFRGTTTNNDNTREIPSQGIIVNTPPKRKGGRISNKAMKKNKDYTQRVFKSPNGLSSLGGEDSLNGLKLPCIPNPNPKAINDDESMDFNDIVIDTCEVEKERKNNDNMVVRDERVGDKGTSSNKLGTHDTENNSVTSRSLNDLGLDDNLDWDSVMPLLNNKGQSLSWELSENMLTWLGDDDEWEKDFHKYTEIDPDQKKNDIFSWF